MNDNQSIFYKKIKSVVLGLSGMVAVVGCADSIPQREDWSVGDHGALVPVSEARGVLVAKVEETPLLVSVLSDRLPGSGSRASLLVVDLLSGEYDQYFPEGFSLGGPYCLLSTERGTFCYMSNDTFYEFDLIEREYRFSTKEIQGYAMSMVESDDGLIYVATYPESWLYEYNPEDKSVKRLVRLDPTEKYPTSMSLGDDGWLYVGVGPANANLVAYHLQTGELRSLTPENERINSAGRTYMLEDGRIVGRINGRSPWHFLSGGEIGEPDTSSGRWYSTRASVYWNTNDWKARWIEGFTDLRVTKYDLAQREIVFRNGKEDPRQIVFDYESLGASISSIGDAGDGKILGSTDHPNQLWRYDTRNHRVEVFGGVPELGGGNLTRWVRYQNQLISNSYSRGIVYSVDLERPIVPDQGTGKPDSNPRQIANTSPHIARPRSLILHSDGKHLISTGFPGYGRVGGGMLIYDLEEDRPVELLETENLLPGFTITAMTNRNNGNLIVGTSVLTPGGATPVEEYAVIAEFDWESRKISRRLEIPLEANHVIALRLIEDRYLHIATASSEYLLYDLEKSSLIKRESLAPYGGATGSRGDTSFIRHEDGRLFLVGRNALLELDPQTGVLQERARFPYNVYDAGPIVDDVLYLAAASHLLSVKISEK